MVYAHSFLLLAVSSNPVMATQQRLDEMVNRCDAEQVIWLEAQSASEVLILPLHIERPPTADENRQIECVFEQLEAMPDLQLGFLGNAAPEDANSDPVR